MARPSEINTRTISVRVPIDLYVEILKTASGLNMSISDYMLLRLIDSKPSKQEKETPKTDDWKLINTFSNKESFRHSAFTQYQILKLKKGTPVISKNGKFKLVAIHKGKNHVYEKK